MPIRPSDCLEEEMTQRTLWWQFVPYVISVVVVFVIYQFIFQQEAWLAVFIGWAVALGNHFAGGLIQRWGVERKNDLMMMISLSGIRFVSLLTILFVVIVFTHIPHYPFVVSVFTTYFIFLFYDLAQLSQQVIGR